MKRKFVFSILFFFISSAVFSQDLFRSKNGVLIITGSLKDTVAKLTSNKLVTSINYERASVSMKVKRNSFYTGNADYDSIISRLKPDFLIFDGKFSLDFIPEEIHSTLEFQVEGTLTNDNYMKKISGKGRLASTFSAPFSSELTIVFYLKLKDLNLNFGIEGLKDDIQIEIVQNLMDRSPY